MCGFFPCLTMDRRIVHRFYSVLHLVHATEKRIFVVSEIVLYRCSGRMSSLCTREQREEAPKHLALFGRLRGSSKVIKTSSTRSKPYPVCSVFLPLPPPIYEEGPNFGIFENSRDQADPIRKRFVRRCSKDLGHTPLLSRSVVQCVWPSSLVGGFRM